MRPLNFIGSSHRDLLAFPDNARSEAGYALFLAQEGDRAINAIPMTGFHGASVLEVVIPEGRDAYRAVYTVKFPLAVYVLHAFQKKSKKGISTPLQEMTLIRRRLKEAERDYRENYGIGEQEKRHERGSRER